MKSIFQLEYKWVRVQRQRWTTISSVKNNIIFFSADWCVPHTIDRCIVDARYRKLYPAAWLMTVNKLPSVSLLIAINLSPHASPILFQCHILESATHVHSHLEVHIHTYCGFTYVYRIPLHIHLSHSCHRPSSIFRADSGQPNNNSKKNCVQNAHDVDRKLAQWRMSSN